MTRASSLNSKVSIRILIVILLTLATVSPIVTVVNIAGIVILIKVILITNLSVKYLNYKYKVVNPD